MAVIKAVLGGNTAAYTQLVHEYQSYVFTLCRRYVHEREVAEELAQDVFIKAYRSLADYKGMSKFSTWLYTIVHTTCLSHLRRKASPVVLPGDDAMHAAMGGMAAPGDPLDALSQKMNKQLLDNAMRALPALDAELMTLFYQAGQSVEEIAAITGLTPGNIKVRLLRARQKLKAIIEKKYPQEITG